MINQPVPTPEGVNRQQFLQALLRRVQQLTPVRTGRLRAGWQVTDTGIANPVEYAEYVENGTPRRPARGMLARALADMGIE